MLRFQHMHTNAKLKQLEAALYELGYVGPHLILNRASGSVNGCIFAKDCDAWADRITGKITNGEHQEFRCYAASLEAAYSSVRSLVHHNSDVLREAWRDGREGGLFATLRDGLIREGAWDTRAAVRIHSHGEFFHRDYWKAWLSIASSTPTNLYYCYTKAVPWYLDSWIAGEIPPNFRVTLSRGGTHDHLIDLHGLKEAVVVESEADAWSRGLEVDHDDSHAALHDRSFALVIHGTGNKGYRSRREIPLEMVAD